MNAALQLPIEQISLPTPFAIGNIHTYIVRQDPITLIDTGLNTQASREALTEGLRVRGLTVKDIRRVLITHAHHDHWGLAGWVAGQSGAEVWLHPDEAGKADTPDWWVEGRNRTLAEAGVPNETVEQTELYWKMGRKMVSTLEGGWRPLHDGQQFGFEGGGALEAVHLPGHALGHTGFLDRAGGVLMGGDHLLMGVTPNPIMEPLPEGHPAGAPHAPFRALTLGQFITSQNLAVTLPVQRVFPGHGPVIESLSDLAQGYISRHERRLETLLTRLGTGSTVFDLTRQVYPRVQGVDVFLALSEVLAHLDLLVARHRAVVEPSMGAVLFRPAV